MGGLLVAGASWGMAEFFTRRRRMALPSIVLLLGFVGGIGGFGIELLGETAETMSDQLQALLLATIGVLAALGAWLHWQRFHVPITVAAGAAAVAVTVIALILGMISPQPSRDTETLLLPLVFAAGLGVFAYAMHWDMSDRARETRRSDVAFWLHLLAAPMIAHPLFNWLGVTQGVNIGAGAAVGVLVIYVGMALVALAVDRRALLVSALAYVLIALTAVGHLRRGRAQRRDDRSGDRLGAAHTVGLLDADPRVPGRAAAGRIAGAAAGGGLGAAVGVTSDAACPGRLARKRTARDATRPVRGERGYAIAVGLRARGSCRGPPAPDRRRTADWPRAAGSEDQLYRATAASRPGSRGW